MTLSLFERCSINAGVAVLNHIVIFYNDRRFYKSLFTFKNPFRDKRSGLGFLLCVYFWIYTLWGLLNLITAIFISIAHPYPESSKFDL